MHRLPSCLRREDFVPCCSIVVRARKPIFESSFSNVYELPVSASCHSGTIFEHSNCACSLEAILVDHGGHVWNTDRPGFSKSKQKELARTYRTLDIGADITDPTAIREYHSIIYAWILRRIADRISNGLYDDRNLELKRP